MNSVSWENRAISKQMLSKFKIDPFFPHEFYVISSNEKIVSRLLKILNSYFFSEHWWECAHLLLFIF